LVSLLIAEESIKNIDVEQYVQQQASTIFDSDSENDEYDEYDEDINGSKRKAKKSGPKNATHYYQPTLKPNS